MLASNSDASTHRFKADKVLVVVVPTPLGVQRVDEVCPSPPPLVRTPGRDPREGVAQLLARCPTLQLGLALAVPAPTTLTPQPVKAGGAQRLTVTAGEAPGLVCRPCQPNLPEPLSYCLGKALGVALLLQRAHHIVRVAPPARLSLAAWSDSLMQPHGERIMQRHLGEDGRAAPPLGRTARGGQPGAVRLQPPRLEPLLDEPQERSSFTAFFPPAEPPIMGARVEAPLAVRFHHHRIWATWEFAGELVSGLLGPKMRTISIPTAQTVLRIAGCAYPRDRKVPERICDGGPPERAQLAVALRDVLPSDGWGAVRLPREPLDQRVDVGVEVRRIVLGTDAVSPLRRLLPYGAPALFETRLVAQRVEVAEPVLRRLVGLRRSALQDGWHWGSGPPWPVKVPWAGSVCLSAPSPCERRDRLRVLWAARTPWLPSASLLGLASLLWAGATRASPVPDASRHAYHALRWPPTDPRDAHHNASSG